MKYKMLIEWNDKKFMLTNTKCNTTPDFIQVKERSLRSVPRRTNKSSTYYIRMNSY